MKADMHKVKMACIHTKIPHACLVQYSHMQQDGFRIQNTNSLNCGEDWNVMMQFYANTVGSSKAVCTPALKSSCLTKKTSKITCT